MHAENITVRFDRSPHGLPWSGVSGTDETIVWLTEPLLTWTLSDLADPAWVSKTYSIFKRFLGVANREYQLLTFGQSSQLTWSTNNLDSIQSSFGFMRGDPKEFTVLAQQCSPCIKSLLLHAAMMQEETGHSLMIPLLALVAGLRGHGVDVDPSDMFTKLFVSLRKSPESNVAKPQIEPK